MPTIKLLFPKAQKNSLTPFKHNGFNIVFPNAASAYFLASDITALLEYVHGTPNNLPEAVLADIKE